MTPYNRDFIIDRLQVCSIALGSIDESTDRSIVLQRIKEALKSIGMIGKLMHAEADEPDHHAPLGALKEE